MIDHKDSNNIIESQFILDSSENSLKTLIKVVGYKEKLKKSQNNKISKEKANSLIFYLSLQDYNVEESF